MDAWVRKYIGIPFKDKGRDGEGLDCWGLVRTVLKNEFGKELPDLSDGYGSIRDVRAISKLIDETKPLIEAKPVEYPEIGDIAVIRCKGLPLHVGIYVGSGYILHTERTVESMIERMSSPAIKNRIEGWYHV